LRSTACHIAKCCGVIANKKWNIGYKIRLVLSDEPRFVDSTVMTASQMADGSHTLRIRLVDEINRENTFYRFSAISTASSIYAELFVVLWPDNDPE
jgi:hypothetical protein